MKRLVTAVPLLLAGLIGASSPTAAAGEVSVKINIGSWHCTKGGSIVSNIVTFSPGSDYSYGWNPGNTSVRKAVYRGSGQNVQVIGTVLCKQWWNPVGYKSDFAVTRWVDKYTTHVHI